QPCKKLRAKPTVPLEPLGVGRVLERSWIVSALRGIPSERAEHVFGMTAEIGPHGRRPPDALHVDDELREPLFSQGTRIERPLVRREPRAELRTAQTFRGKPTRSRDTA